MAQKEIEVILMRQLSGYLAMPVFLVDPAGDLVYFNEAAEKILGHRFDETGPLPSSAWLTTFQPTDDEGTPLPLEAIPLTTALVHRRPAHRIFTLTAFDGIRKRIESTALPLLGHGGRFLGAVALFWEVPA